MKKQKLTYSAPTTETLVVGFEGVICQSNYGVMLAAGLGFNDANSNITDYTTGADF